MNFDLESILGIVFFLISLGLTGWITKVKTLLKEVSEALSVISVAMEDNKISPEEVKKIAKEFQDIIDVAKKFRK